MIILTRIILLILLLSSLMHPILVDHHLLHSLDYINPDITHPSAPLVAGHLLGTDSHGIDILSFILHLIKYNVSSLVIIICLTFAIGVTLGIIAGYYGGICDLIIVRIQELLSTFPQVILFIVMYQVFAINHYIYISCAMGLLFWPTVADMVRKEALTIKHASFIINAQLMMLPGWRIIWYHLMPNVLVGAKTAVPILIKRSIIYMLILEFIGTNVNNNSIGAMMWQGLQNPQALWIVLIPSVLTTLYIYAGSNQ